MKCSLFIVAILSICALFIATVDAYAQAAPINLAFVLPKTQPTAAADHSDMTQGAKNDDAAATLAATALVMSDDKGIYRTVQGSIGPAPAVRKAANAVTNLGNLEFVAPLLGAVYLTGGHTNENLAWKSGVAIIRAGIIGTALKVLVGRQRPDEGQKDKNAIPPGGSADTFHPLHPQNRSDSFPSGHTLVAFAVGTVWASEKPRESILAYGLASLVGTSRIIKGAHWPSDVLVGALIGISQGRQAIRGNINLLNLHF